MAIALLLGAAQAVDVAEATMHHRQSFIEPILDL